MINRLRQQLAVKGRPRPAFIALLCLCFMIAAMPCGAAFDSACCPPMPAAATADAHAMHHGAASSQHQTHGDHGTHHASMAHSETSAGTLPCWASMGDACCEQSLPTLDDRSPKTPERSDSGPLWTPLSFLLTTAEARHSGYRATGPPPVHRGLPRRHVLLETFLN
ncbi:MAG: hypothetical protein HRU51_00600 [Xanthomonadales bacterium]|nr:hypothetical protein [Xanthomonadales bacterium]